MLKHIQFNVHVIAFLGILMGTLLNLNAQENAPDNKVYDTFLSTRLINAQTVETLPKRTLDVRITHRFGNVSSGISEFWGLDNATDIRISFEYGLGDNLMVGIGRSKGDGAITKLYDGFVKYRFLQQHKKGMPISATVFANAAYTAAQATNNLADVRSFSTLSEEGDTISWAGYRLSYVAQLLIARKFGDRFALQLAPTYLHRNLVTAGDENNTFALGIGTRFSLSKHYAIVLDYYHVFSAYRDYFNAEQDALPEAEQAPKFYAPLGIGLEVKTGGHVFHLNFSNSTTVLENAYLVNTRDSWWQWQFRLGFNISRPFKI